MEAAGEYPAEVNMGITEVILIILGIAAFVASFLIPESFSKQEEIDTKLQEEKLHEFLEKELQQAEFQFEEKTGETINAATEKTERYMERITNEKIMAVQEYSDTVLNQIHKNHEEAVFLYDMLNNKHVQVKNTAAEINNKMVDVKADLQSGLQEHQAEELAKVVEEQSNVDGIAGRGNSEVSKAREAVLKKKNSEKKNNTQEQSDNESAVGVEVQFDPELDMVIYKDKVLALHKEGKSNMTIAKSLGLGIGEVKLIIDLFVEAK